MKHESATLHRLCGVKSWTWFSKPRALFILNPRSRDQEAKDMGSQRKNYSWTMLLTTQHSFHFLGALGFQPKELIIPAHEPPFLCLTYVSGGKMRTHITCWPAFENWTTLSLSLTSWLVAFPWDFQTKRIIYSLTVILSFSTLYELVGREKEKLSQLLTFTFVHAFHNTFTLLCPSHQFVRL